MVGQISSSPLLLKYLKTLEEDPASRVFAPLGETYRRLGQVEKAVEVLKAVTGGKLRFGVDIVGAETASALQEALQQS